MKFLTSSKLSEHRYKTPEGYLVCVDAIIARTGKQEYHHNELFADSNDDSIIEVDRPYKEVFSPATIASFENKPLVDEHPDEDVNVENYKNYAVGFIRDVHEGEENGKPVLMANIIVTDPTTIEEIENGKTQLSCGYDCDILGDSEKYQANIRGNHVALCEQGRAGNARIVDSENIKDDASKLVQALTVLQKNGFDGFTNRNSGDNYGTIHLDWEFRKKTDEAIKILKKNGFNVEYGESATILKVYDSIKDSKYYQLKEKLNACKTKEDYHKWLQEVKKDESLSVDELDKLIKFYNSIKDIQDSLKDTKTIKYKGFTIEELEGYQSPQYNVYDKHGWNMNSHLSTSSDLKQIKREIDLGYLDDYVEDSVKDKRWEVGNRVRYEGRWYYIVAYNRGDWILEPEDGSRGEQIRVRADDSFKDSKNEDSVKDSANDKWWDLLYENNLVNSYVFINGGYGMKFKTSKDYYKAKELATKCGYLKESTWNDKELTVYDFRSERIENDSVKDAFSYTIPKGTTLEFFNTRNFGENFKLVEGAKKYTFDRDLKNVSKRFIEEYASTKLEEEYDSHPRTNWRLYNWSSIDKFKVQDSIQDDYSGFLGNYGFDYLKGSGDYEYWYLKYRDEDFQKLVDRIRKEYPMLIISSNPREKTIYIQKSKYKKDSVKDTDIIRIPHKGFAYVHNMPEEYFKEPKYEYVNKYLVQSGKIYKVYREKLSGNLWATTNFKDSVKDGKYDDYFGQEEYEKYGKLVKSKLRGKTISKRRDLSEQENGLEYEAKKLGISPIELLRCLEGMCYNGEARENYNSSYTIKDSVKDTMNLKELENELDKLYCISSCYSNNNEIVAWSNWKTTQRQTEKDRIELMQWLDKNIGRNNYSLVYKSLDTRDNGKECAIKFSIKLKDSVKDEPRKKYIVTVYYKTHYGAREKFETISPTYQEAKKTCISSMKVYYEKYKDVDKNNDVMGFVSCQYNRQRYTLNEFEIDKNGNFKDVTNTRHFNIEEAKKLGLYDSVENVRSLSISGFGYNKNDFDKALNEINQLKKDGKIKDAKIKSEELIKTAEYCLKQIDNVNLDKERKYYDSIICQLNDSVKDADDKMIKAIIFKSNENLSNSKFTDFMNEGISKLNNNTYIVWWHSGKSHQSVAQQYKDISDVEYIALSDTNGNLDLSDLNNLIEHKEFKNDITIKAKKYFRDSIENKPVTVLVVFDDNKEANDALKSLKRKEEFMNSDLLFDNTIKVETTDLFVDKLKKDLKLFFVKKIIVKGGR